MLAPWKPKAWLWIAKSGSTAPALHSREPYNQWQPVLVSCGVRLYGSESVCDEGESGRPGDSASRPLRSLACSGGQVVQIEGNVKCGSAMGEPASRQEVYTTGRHVACRV
jgi:hypothetical protein